VQIASLRPFIHAQKQSAFALVETKTKAKKIIFLIFKLMPRHFVGRYVF